MYVVLPIIPYPAINPILISIGPFAVRWYALAYIVGIIAGWFYARALIASERLWGGPAPFTVLDFDDFVIWITLGIILGGRTGYVLFYNLPLFAAHPVQIFELWTGGMSFHGGVLGCAVAIVLFALRGGTFRCCRSPTSPPASRRSACFSAGSPISSTANCGAGRPMCPGPWCFPMAGRSRAIRASFMKRRWKASCCSSCSRS